MQNMPLEHLYQTFLDRVQSQTVPYFNPGPEVLDQKRDYNIALYGQHIPLYPISELNNISFDDQDDRKIRFVVDSNYQLILANHEKPSNIFAQHREMPKNKYCIAAGYIILSEDGSGKITRVSNSCNDYASDLSSLVWPLMILNLCEVNFSQEVILAHHNEKIGVYSADELSVFLKRLSDVCANSRPSTMFNINKSATIDHIDTVAKRSIFPNVKKNRAYPELFFNRKRKATEPDNGSRCLSVPRNMAYDSKIFKANKDALQDRLDKLSNTSFKPI